MSTSMTLAQNAGVEAVNEAPGPSHHHHRQGSFWKDLGGSFQLVETMSK